MIVPAYNAHETLAETIDSVLNQSIDELECIIVNDGSTDGTDEVALSYTDHRIVYYEQNNLERSVARNIGAALSSGFYLAFLDADDIWLPTKLEKQVQLLQSQGNLGLVYCDVIYFDGETKEDIGAFSQMTKLERGSVFERLLWKGNFIQSPTPVIRREVFDRVGGYDPSLVPLEDWDLWLRITRMYPVDYIPLPLARYRWRQQTVSLARPSQTVHASYLRLLNKVETNFCQSQRSLQWKIKFLRLRAWYQFGMTGLCQLFPAQPDLTKA